MNDFLLTGIIQGTFAVVGITIYSACELHTYADANTKKLSRYLLKKSSALLTFVFQTQIKCYLTGKFQLVAGDNFAGTLIILTFFFHDLYASMSIGGLTMAALIFCSSLFAGIFKFTRLRKNRCNITFDSQALNAKFDDLLGYQLTLAFALNERLNIHLRNLEYNCKMLDVNKQSRRRRKNYLSSSMRSLAFMPTLLLKLKVNNTLI